MKQLKKIQIITVLFLVTGFIGCSPSSETEPGFDPNSCNEYACPLHKDKVFIASEVCPECGLQMIRKSSLDSLFSRIERSSSDSLKLYHELIIEQSDQIMMNDSTSREEKIKALTETRKNLNKAKAIYENPDSLAFGKDIIPFKPQSGKLAYLYAAATYRINIISNELAKQNYDRQKVKLYSSELREIIIEIDQHILPNKHRSNQ